MAKVIWGLDFGAWALKVVRGAYDKKTDTITIDLFDSIVYGTLPCGYEASPLDKHREGVIAFQGKYEIGPKDVLCVSVPGSEVFSRFINLPPVPESIGEIIRYEARQQIPFDINDVVWDYQPVKPREELQEGEEIEVGLFALKKERADELMDLLAPWRDNLRVIQDAPLAVYNLLSYEGLADDPAVVVDVGAATTDVLVLNPPRFWVRTLLVAGDDLTNALAEQFGIGNDEAEKIKRKAGRSAHREQILRILQPVFDELTNEIQRSLGYYKSLAREVRFERVLALGNALRMTGLPQMLAAGLQYPVQGVVELSRAQLADTVDKDRFAAMLPGLCAALGLVVQGAGKGRVQINMVPEEVAMASQVAAKKPWLLAAAIGLLLLVGILIFGERVYAHEIADAGTGLDWGVLDEAESLQTKVKAETSQANRLNSQLSSLARPGIRRDLFLELLPIYADTIPDDVYTKVLLFDWMEPGEISGDMATASGERGGAGSGAARRTAGMAAGAGRVGAARAGAMRALAARRGGGGAAAGEPGGEAGSVAAGSGAQARLVVRFACESSVISRDYIEREVFEALGSVKLPNGEPAFTKAEMLADVRDLYREAATGDVVQQSGPGVDQYLIFDGYAVVNLGQKDVE